MTYGVANARHTGSPIDVALAYYTDSLKLGIDMFFARREEEIRQEKNNEQKKKPFTAGEIVEVLNHGIKKNLKKAEVGTVTITAEGFVRELAKKVEQHYRLSADTDVMHRGRKVTVETMLRDFSLAAFHQMDDGVFTLVKEGADYKRLVSDFENGLDYSHLKTETCSTSRAYVAYAIRTPGLGKPVFRPEDIVMLDHDAGPEKLAELHKANKVVVVNGSIVPNPSKPREAGIMLDYVPDPHVLEVPRKLPAFILPPLLNGVTQRNSEHGIVAPLVAAAAKPKAAGTHHIRKG